MIPWFTRQPIAAKIAIIGATVFWGLIIIGSIGAAIAPPPEKTEVVSSGVSTDTKEAEEPESGPKPAPVSTTPPAPQENSAKAAEDAYTSEIVVISSQYSAALADLSKLSTDASEDPTLFLDDDWTIDMAVALATMATLNQDARALSPPARFVGVHNYLLNAVGHFEVFIPLFSQGIDELNPDKIDQATAELLLGSEQIQKATEEIDKIQ